MTQLTVIWLGTLAAIATTAMFLPVADRWTQVIIPFLASLLWGMFALSSGSVHAQAFGDAAEPMTPLVYLGVAFAMATLVYGVYDLVVGIGKQAAEADAGNMFG